SGHKECELIRYAAVAKAASVSWQKAESCIRDTTSLMSHCLHKGESVALVLKDVGVLLVEGTRVRMRFYYDFLERLSGKKNLEEAVFKIPRLMDVIVSRVTSVASLTFSGRVIIFP
ncbi:CCD81 protein, partial [Odontophorus gujanensis]|nr:CCD81 protein [Odontophorus gujanensis]